MSYSGHSRPRIFFDWARSLRRPPAAPFTEACRQRNFRKSVGYRSTATAHTTRAPWCLRGPAWLLPQTNPALARPWDRQTGSLEHRNRMHVGSAMGYRSPLAHRPSAARQFRSGPRPLSPTSPPCTHPTLGYSPKLVENILGTRVSAILSSRKPSFRNLVVPETSY